MCGIVGVASGLPVSDRAWLPKGRDAMAHRGPDDVGEWWSPDGCVGLAHRRLAIVDLSAAGHQPMQDLSGSVTITFNGEIYNFQELRDELAARGHRFRSTSDTEVILAAYREWGTDCLARLNGAFAFAIHDAPGRRVLLARDRAGEKPLFYTLAGGALRFASELKALLADPALPRRIDPTGLDCYLAVGYVPGARCMLEGFRKLPPAHALSYDLSDGSVRIWRYWDIPSLDPDAPEAAEPEPALVDRFESLLADAVRRQMVADVPVGVLLSGGVDSSLVTAMAVRTASTVRTFTVRFPGHRLYDETEHARLIARHFGTEHLELDAAEASVDILPRLARQFDEPMVDSSMIPTYLVSRLIREHCTVALGGDGGDELFGGYPLYSRLLWTARLANRIPRVLRRPVARSATAFLPVGFKGRVWLQVFATDFRRSIPVVAGHFDRPTRRRLLAARGLWPLRSEGIRAETMPRVPDLLQRATRMDFETYLPEDILVKVDRASMLNSLEVRAPLLDHRIVEFAFGRVPSRLKTTPDARKILLRRLAARLFPPTFDQRRKQGFSIPLSSWLRNGPWREMFGDVLLSSSNGLFDREVVQGLIEGISRGHANGERLFGLVMFDLWRREYGVSI